MAKFKVFQIEPLGSALVPMLITTALTNPGGYFKAEFFLAIPDDECFFKAQRFDFAEKSFRPGGRELNEDFMLRLAYQRGRLALSAFVRAAAQKYGPELYPRRPEILEDDRELLLNYWIAGSCTDHLVQIGRRTKCEELTEYIKWVLTLPEFDKQDL